jgi:carboxymethylenebutenolidase
LATHYQPGVKTEAGYLAVPASGSGPGILVLHAFWGLNAFFTALCDRLAAEGYIALAPDFYGGKVASTVDAAMALADGLETQPTEDRILAGLAALQQLPGVQGNRTALIGFSLGGSWAIHLSAIRPDTVAATVLFYGIGDADFSEARCAYLEHYPEKDEWDAIDVAEWMVTKMRDAGLDVTFYIYPGAKHWFFEDDVPEAYNAEAAALAWERTLEFLRQHLP